MKVIGCTWSCDQSSDLCRVTERSNISLPLLFLLLLLLLLLFLLLLIFLRAWGQTLRHRRATIYPTYAGAINWVCRSSLITGLKCLSNTMSFSILPDFKMPFFTVSCESTHSSSRFFSCTSTIFVSDEVSTTTSYVTISQTCKILFFYLHLSALFLLIARNSYFFCQQSRHNKIRRISIYIVYINIHVIVVNVFQVSKVWTRLQQVHVIAYQILGILVYVW